MTNTNELYNGWANRETWLVNLHFGDDFAPYMQALEEEEPGWLDDMDVWDIAEQYEQYIENFLADELEGLSLFLKDFIDLGRINWKELAENVMEEIKE